VHAGCKRSAKLEVPPEETAQEALFWGHPFSGKEEGGSKTADEKRARLGGERWRRIGGGREMLEGSALHKEELRNVISK